MLQELGDSFCSQMPSIKDARTRSALGYRSATSLTTWAQKGSECSCMQLHGLAAWHPCRLDLPGKARSINVFWYLKLGTRIAGQLWVLRYKAQTKVWQPGDMRLQRAAVALYISTALIVRAPVLATLHMLCPSAQTMNIVKRMVLNIDVSRWTIGLIQASSLCSALRRYHTM